MGVRVRPGPCPLTAMTFLTQITGWGGALLLLSGYILTLVRDWKVDSGRYLVLSCTAAALLCINSYMNDAWPFLVINMAILLVALYNVLKKGWPSWR
jgi:hypothetical protein